MLGLFQRKLAGPPVNEQYRQAVAALDRAFELGRKEKMAEMVALLENAIPALEKATNDKAVAEAPIKLGLALKFCAAGKQSLGDHAGAVDAFGRAIQVYERLLADDITTVIDELALNYVGKGSALYVLNRFQEAQGSFHQAVLLYQQMIKEGHDASPQLAGAFLKEGMAEANAGNRDAASDLLAKGVKLFETLVDEQGRREFTKELEAARQVLAQWIAQRPNSTPAESDARRPNFMECLEEANQVRNSSPKQAEKLYEEAISQLRVLIKSPGQSDLRELLGITLMLAAGVALDLGRLQKAIAYCDEGVELGARLELEGRDDPRGLLAQSLDMRAAVLCAMKNYRAAITAADQAIAAATKQAARGNEAARSVFATAFRTKIDSLKTLEQWSEVAATADRAIQLFEDLAKRDRAYRLHLAHACMDKGMALVHGGSPNEADPAIDKAIQLYKQLVDERKNDARLVEVYALACWRRGKALCAARKHREALALYEHAIPAVETVRARDTDSLDLTEILVELYHHRGDARYKARNFSAAIESLDKAIQFDQQLVLQKKHHEHATRLAWSYALKAMALVESHDSAAASETIRIALEQLGSLAEYGDIPDLADVIAALRTLQEKFAAESPKPSGPAETVAIEPAPAPAKGRLGQSLAPVDDEALSLSDHLHRGRQALARGDNGGAIFHFEMALVELMVTGPLELTAVVNLKMALLQVDEGNINYALAYFGRGLAALEQAQDGFGRGDHARYKAAAHYLKALALAQDGQSAEAEQAFVFASALNPALDRRRPRSEIVAREHLDEALSRFFQDKGPAANGAPPKAASPPPVAVQRPASPAPDAGRLQPDRGIRPSPAVLPDATPPRANPAPSPTPPPPQAAAETPRSEYLTPENLSLETLASILDAACMPVSIEGEELRVKDRVTCWISTNGERRDRVQLQCAFGFKPEVPQIQRLDVANRINNGFAIIKAIVDTKDVLRFTYDLMIGGGIARKAFVLAVKRFCAIPHDAVAQFGTDSIQ